MRTRMSGGVGAGRAILPATRLAPNDCPFAIDQLHLVTGIRRVVNRSVSAIRRGNIQRMPSGPLPQKLSPRLMRTIRQSLQDFLSRHRKDRSPDFVDVLLRELTLNFGRFGPLLVGQPEIEYVPFLHIEDPPRIPQTLRGCLACANWQGHPSGLPEFGASAHAYSPESSIAQNHHQRRLLNDWFVQDHVEAVLTF